MINNFYRSKLWYYTERYHNVSLMAKFIFSMGNENFRKLQLEAKTRDVTIQALIRTVVIPEWIRTHIDTSVTATTTHTTAANTHNTHTSMSDTSNLLPHTTGFMNPHRSFGTSVGRRQ